MVWVEQLYSTRGVLAVTTSNPVLFVNLKFSFDTKQTPVAKTKNYCQLKLKKNCRDIVLRGIVTYS